MNPLDKFKVVAKYALVACNPGTQPPDTEIVAALTAAAEVYGRELVQAELERVKVWFDGSNAGKGTEKRFGRVEYKGIEFTGVEVAEVIDAELAQLKRGLAPQEANGELGINPYGDQ